MENVVLEERGTPVDVFGEHYNLVMSCNVLAKMEEELGELDQMAFGYKTVPTVLRIMIDAYCDDHPEAKRFKQDELTKKLSPAHVKILQNLFVEMLEDSDTESKKK